MKPRKNILWLSFIPTLSGEGIEDLFHYGAQHGIDINLIPFRKENPPGFFEDLIRQADSYLLSDTDIIDCEPFKDEVIKEIRAGKRLAVIRPKKELNPFLMNFDLAITKERLCGPQDLFGDDRTILVRSEDQANHVASALMAGSEVTMHGPSFVWYGATANPIFETPPGSRVLNEGDFFVDPGARKLCCGGLWHDDNSTGSVLLIAGSSLRNPYQGMTGKFFAGIRANTISSFINTVRQSGDKPDGRRPGRR